MLGRLRFCGYAEALVGESKAENGLKAIWAAYADGGMRKHVSKRLALEMHQELIFGKHASDAGISTASRKQALKVLVKENGQLPKATVLRCKVRYFTDGAILGSAEFVRGFTGA